MQLLLSLIFIPLLMSILVGVFGDFISKRLSHILTILGVLISFICSVMLLNDFLITQQTQDILLFNWSIIGEIEFQIGFLVDSLSLAMASMITFVSLMVHIYTIGYMEHDEGYKRFFSYISLFTFSMLMLIFSNNLLQLFFGWEAVGLVSYLLIGFWFKKPSAIHANMKAFIVNRVGDLGFIIGIAIIVYYTGSLHLGEIFSQLSSIEGQLISILPSSSWNAVTVASICLFIGAMGKSAQMPLHVWLPDSMEGPTPISALIHAATMVTAGIFLIARMSPLIELSSIALSFILIIGSLTAFFMGLLGLVQNDIKRVVAYSTLSQLGYMTAALGVSAYSVGVYHLITHGFFKALLFLGAGSVIIALHHEQDIRQMGGLRKKLPITYITFLIGTLSLIGFPGFSGFFSKDTLIEAVHLSEQGGSHLSYYLLLMGVLITTLYSMRLLFLVFHGSYRSTHYPLAKVHETPWVVTLPLLLLAIPSIFLGGLIIDPMIMGGYFSGSIFVSPENQSLQEFIDIYHGVIEFIIHAFVASPAIYLMLLGILISWLIWYKNFSLPKQFASLIKKIETVFKNKYYFDYLYENIFSQNIIRLGKMLHKWVDAYLIDSVFVLGSARTVQQISSKTRQLHTGDLTQVALIFFVLLVIFTAFWIS